MVKISRNNKENIKLIFEQTLNIPLAYLESVPKIKKTK